MIRFANVQKLMALAAIMPLASAAIAQGRWVHASAVTNQIEAYQEHYKVPGLSIAVVKDNKVVYSRAFGWANVKDKIPATEETWFRLASVSKPVTAILAMELEQQGKFHRNNPIREILPELPGHHTYRLWHLLSHQSGVRHYDGKNFDTDKQYDSMFDATKRFSKDELRFKPGQEYHYSTHGYTVLGAAIERVSGLSFNQYLVKRRNAWGGMTHLQCDTQSEHAKVSRTYDRDGNKVRETERDNTSWKAPGGGMMSNARDLATLGIRLNQGKILSQKNLDTMWDGRDAKIEDSNYGLGWGVGSWGGTLAVSHSGAQNGAGSFWRILPKKGVVVVVLGNSRDHKPSALANYLTTAALADAGDSLPKMILD